MQPIRILFVDDDADETYLFNEALDHSGISVELTHINNGNKLLKHLAERPLPDMVFIDINMPYKDGHEVLTEIRSCKEYKDLPLIMYSTTKNIESIHSCYEKGANLFIIKPNNFDGMVSVIKKVCAIDWKKNKRPQPDAFVLTEDHQYYN